MMHTVKIIAILLLVGVGIAMAVWAGQRVVRAGLRVVPTGHVGIIYRRYGRHPDRRFKRVTPYKARGIQAGILLPDRRCWLWPVLYELKFEPMVQVPEGMVGLVSAKEGAHRPADRPLGRVVECDSFQDGEAFLLGGGEQGRQVQTLAGDTAYCINTELFSVEFVPRTYVPPGAVGLVIAKAGEVRPPDRPLGRFVECNNFQDGQAFLRGGGEQGRQLAILAGGAYYDINPALFEVITEDNVASARDGLTAHHLKEIAIPIGFTGVVITLDGAEPDGEVIGPRVDGHRSFRLPWVFLAAGGYRGVQEETLGEGAVYSLNPWFVRVMLIPTRLLYMEWTTKEDDDIENYDASLDRIGVNIQGHELYVEMSQTLRIPRAAAPRLVSRFGGGQTSGLGGLVNDRGPVRRFVERVLGATVAAYFSGIATAATIDDFLKQYASTRTDLARQVKQKLEAWDVLAETTNLGEFKAEDPEFNKVRKKEFNEQARGKELKVKRENVVIEDEIDALAVRAEERRTALELKAEIAALGRENVAQIRMIRELAKWKGPEYIGGDISAYVDTMPMMLRRDLLQQLRQLHFQNSLSPVAPTALPGRPNLVPVYVMLDESSASVNVLDEGMQGLCDVLADAPDISRAVHLAVLGYAGDVAERLSLQGARPGFTLSPLRARGGARFGVTFAWLLDHIGQDVERLENQNFAVRGPQVIFLTSHEPDDGAKWRLPYRQLVDRAQNPNAPDIVAFGIGSVTAATVAGIATRREWAFLANSQEPREAGMRFCEFVRTYVLNLARAVVGGGRDPQIVRPEGFRPVSEDS